MQNKQDTQDTQNTQDTQDTWGDEVLSLEQSDVAISPSTGCVIGEPDCESCQ